MGKTGRNNNHFFRPEQVRDIADRVKEFRHLNGLSQRGLAKAMGLGKWGRRQVQRIENREHVPWASTFERFLAVEAKHERESEDAAGD